MDKKAIIIWGALFGVFVLIIVGGIGVVTECSCPHTATYNTGYHCGYAEHNNTKYSAANNITFEWYAYTDNQTEYAQGYTDGYDDYIREERLQNVSNERNETARILGV